MEATPQWAVNTIDQEVTFEKTETPDLIYLNSQIEISPVNPYIIPGFRQNLLIDCSCL